MEEVILYLESRNLDLNKLLYHPDQFRKSLKSFLSQKKSEI